MLVSSGRKRDFVAVLSGQVSRNVATRGFGMVAMYEQWKEKQRPGIGLHYHHHAENSGCSSSSSYSKRPRPASPAAMALLIGDDDDTVEAEDCTSPEKMLQRLCATSHAEEPAFEWKCNSCNNTDKRSLIKGVDSTMTCSRCSVVAFGVAMVSTPREKACSLEDDRTVHADAPKEKRDVFCGDDVETAEQARSRRGQEVGGCFIPSNIRQRNGIHGAYAKVNKAAAYENWDTQKSLSPLNCTRNRALQVELVGLYKLVAPVHSLLQRHVRITAHQLLVRSQLHEAACSSGCGISLSGVSAGLIAKVLLRVVAEALLPLHGKEECPLRLQWSREELVGLVDRCNRLVLKEGVHSALCRTAIDILLNGDYTTPCISESNPKEDPLEAFLAKKNEYAEMQLGNEVNAVRDTIWSLSKTRTITDRVRDALLCSLRIETIRKWVTKEATMFTCELVSLRLARAVNSRMNPTNTQFQCPIVSSMQRSCQRSSTSMSRINMDTGVDAIVATLNLHVLPDADDDVLI